MKSSAASPLLRVTLGILFLYPLSLVGALAVFVMLSRVGTGYAQELVPAWAEQPVPEVGERGLETNYEYQQRLAAAAAEKDKREQAARPFTVFMLRAGMPAVVAILALWMLLKIDYRLGTFPSAYWWLRNCLRITLFAGLGLWTFVGIEFGRFFPATHQWATSLRNPVALAAAGAVGLWAAVVLWRRRRRGKPIRQWM